MLSTGSHGKQTKKDQEMGRETEFCSRRSLGNFKLIKGNDHTKERYFLDLLTPCPVYFKVFFLVFSFYSLSLVLSGRIPTP